MKIFYGKDKSHKDRSPFRGYRRVNAWLKFKESIG